jgi:hypothetical protein
MRPYRKENLPGRNDRCPCGSGKKAKRCCLKKIEVFAALPPHVREQVAVAAILGHDPRVAAAPPVLAPPPPAVTEAFAAVSINSETQP